MGWSPTTAHGTVKRALGIRRMLPTAFGRLAVMGAFACSLFLAPGCGGPTRTGGRTDAPEPAPPPVRVVAARRADVPRVAETVGTAKPSVTVQVRARVDGQIRKVHFKEGSAVTEGQLLFEIDSESFEATLKEAEATLEASRATLRLTKIDMDRSENLSKAGAAPVEVFQKARASHENSVAAVARDSAKRDVAKLQLGYCKVLAPIAGIAGKLETDGGSLTRGYDPRPVISINNSQPVYVEFALPERLLPQVRAAAAGPAPFEVEVTKGGNGPPTRGTVDFLDNQVDQATGTLTMRAKFPNRELAIWPGEFFEVRVILGMDRGALVIPSSALGQGNAGQHVFVMGDDNRVSLRKVKVHRIHRDLVLVEDGLREGELVVTEGAVRLQDGVTARRLDGNETP